MFCPTCGEQNPDDARFCAKCATPLTTGGVPSAPPSPPAPPTPAAAAPHVSHEQQQAWTAPAPAPMDMSKVFFVPRLIEYVSQGGLFRRIVAGFLVVAAVIVVLVNLVVSVGMVIGYFDRGGAAILGALLSFPVAVIVTYVEAHILLTRARHVREIPQGDYTVIPIVAILFRLIGELGLVGVVAAGFQGMLGSWFLGASLLGSPFGGYGYGYGGYGAGEALIGGVGLFLASLVAGFVVLLFYYLLSELVVVVVDIARDVRSLRGDTED